MDNRVSKSAVILFGVISAVKEQRVNGSCINKLMLRCTLKGFERNYQVRIPSNQTNKVYTGRCLIKLFVCMINLIALLFILIGIFGSDNRVKASFYLFLYTLTTEISNFYSQCKRAKLRGSPKALVTKVIKETFLLAWLMTGVW